METYCCRDFKYSYWCRGFDGLPNNLTGVSPHEIPASTEVGTLGVLAIFRVQGCTVRWNGFGWKEYGVSSASVVVVDGLHRHLAKHLLAKPRRQGKSSTPTWVVRGRSRESGARFRRRRHSHPLGLNGAARSANVKPGPRLMRSEFFASYCSMYSAVVMPGRHVG